MSMQIVAKTAKPKQIAKFWISNTEGIANIPLINGSRVVENIARQTITAPNAYSLLVNPKLHIVSLFERAANVWIILDNVIV